MGRLEGDLGGTWEDQGDLRTGWGGAGMDLEDLDGPGRTLDGPEDLGDLGWIGVDLGGPFMDMEDLGWTWGTSYGPGRPGMDLGGPGG